MSSGTQIIVNAFRESSSHLHCAGNFQTQPASESVHTISRRTGSPLIRTFRGTFINGYLLCLQSKYHPSPTRVFKVPSRFHDSPRPPRWAVRCREKRPRSSLCLRDRSPASHSRISPPSNNFEKAPMKHTPSSSRITHLLVSVPFRDVGSAMYNLLRQQYSPADFGDEKPAVNRALETMNAVRLVTGETCGQL